MSLPCFHPPCLSCRRALLEHALTEDRERLPDVGTPPTTSRERARAEAQRPQQWVRPGRFMQSLNALQAELLAAVQRGSDGGGATSGTAEGPVAPSPGVLERLESVRREALSVLLDMAGEGAAESPFRP